MISKPRPNALAVSAFATTTNPKEKLRKTEEQNKNKQKIAAQDAVISSLWLRQQCLYLAGPGKITAIHAGIQQRPWRQATPRKKRFSCQTALSVTDISLWSHGNQPLPTGQNHQPPFLWWGGGGGGGKGGPVKGVSSTLNHTRSPERGHFIARSPERGHFIACIPERGSFTIWSPERGSFTELGPEKGGSFTGCRPDKDLL